MKTYFYNRTIYRVIKDIDLPNCFLDIDDFYDNKFDNITNALKNPFVIHTENMCKRMGNVDFYAYIISEEFKNKANMFESAILISSYLIGYFSSCKSFLDSIAIALSDIYKLDLSNKQKDFGKNVFWKKIVHAEPSTTDRYHKYEDIYDEIIFWRDSSIHRVSPLVMVHTSGPPENTPKEMQSIKLLAEPDQFGFEFNSKSNKWCDVLELHHKWRPAFINLCENVLSDIKNNLGKLK